MSAVAFRGRRAARAAGYSGPLEIGEGTRIVPVGSDEILAHRAAGHTTDHRHIVEAFRRGRSALDEQILERLAFRRAEVTVLLNVGTTSAALPEGKVLISSGPLDDGLPPDTAVWVQASASL